MDEETPDVEATEEAEVAQGILSRIRRSPLKMGAMFTLTGAMLLVGAFGVLRLFGPDEGEDVTAQQLLDLLDEGEYTEARRLAGIIKPDEMEAGVVAFAVGRSIVDEAEAEENETRQRALYMIAARYFQEASAKGLPSDRVADGNYYLGTALYHSGLKTQSLPSILRAKDQLLDPSIGPRLDFVLADIYLSDPELSMETGLEHSDNYIDREDLTEEERLEGLLQRADILAALERFDEAEAILATILDELAAESLEVFDTQLRLGKLFIARFRRLSADADLLQDGSLRVKAADALRKAMQHLEVAARGEEIGVAGRYYLAMCELRLGNFGTAADRFGIVRRELVESPMSVPPALGEAEAIQRGGDSESAFTAYLHLLDIATQLNYVESDWMSKQEFEQRLVEAQTEFRRAGKFDLALEFAKRAWPTVERDLAMEMQADTYAEWGQVLEAGGVDEQGNTIVIDKVDSRQKFRDAGLAYYKLSKLRVSSPSYLDYLWNSAEYYFRGRNYQKAVDLYRQYLDEPPETRAARAHLRIGQCYLAVGRSNDAQIALDRCIAFFPSDSDAYVARLLASQVLMAQGKPEEAKAHLRFNIEESALEPESTIWRDSLFQLGKMVYHEGLGLEIESRALGVDSNDRRRIDEGLAKLQESRQMFLETITWLSEAVTRYGTERESIEAKYLLAESYRQAAKFPQKRLRIVTISGTRFQLERQITEELAQAYRLYDELEQHLLQEQDVRTLDQVESRILRNSSFAKADVLFDQKLYPDALVAYQTVSSRYHNRPEALEAFCRAASCHRRNHEPEKAYAVLDQARIFLQERIPPDADFLATTRYSRDEWFQVLDWLQSL